MKNEKIEKLLFILPTCLFLLVISIFPFLYSVYLSLFQAKLTKMHKKFFIGWENYQIILFEDDVFPTAIKNTFMIAFSSITIEIILGFIIAKFTKTIGFHWLSLLIVASELLIVITRFVFSYEQTFMGDLVRYWYAGLFLFASAYTLYEDGHVRVDIIYQGLKEKTKNLVNCFGSILLGWSTSVVIILLCFYGKQSIVNSPVANFEVTQQGSVGMFIKYHMAVFLAIFGITMLIQFISYFFESIADYKNEKGKRIVETSTSH